MLRSALTRAVLLAAMAGAAAPAIAQNKIVVGYTSIAAVSPIFIAKDQGFFDKRGLNVELQALRGGNVLVPSLIANSVQIATLTAPTVVQAVDGGLDIVALTTLSVLNAGMKSSAIIVRKGVDVQTPKDLQGKRVAVGTIGSISQVLFDKWLINKGVDPKKLIYVEASYPQMPDIMKAGNVDAVILPDPLMTAILREGSGTALSYFFGEMPDQTRSMVTAAARDWVKKNPKEVAEFRAAIADAVAWSKGRDQETKDTVGRWLKLSPEVMAATSLEQSVASLSTSDMTWWVDVLNEQKLLRTKVDPGSLVTP